MEIINKFCVKGSNVEMSMAALSVCWSSLFSPFSCLVSCNPEELSFLVQDGSRSKKVVDGGCQQKHSERADERMVHGRPVSARMSKGSTMKADNSLCYMKWFANIQSKSYCYAVERMQGHAMFPVEAAFPLFIILAILFSDTLSFDKS